MAASGRRRSRRKRKVNKMKLLMCGLVELFVVIVLAVIIGWNYGLETWFQDMARPAVKELDISGINSQYAVLIHARGGKVIGEINSEERMYPASLTKIMTAIVAIENLDDLEEQIVLSPAIFEKLYGSDATQAGFLAGESVRAIDLLYGVILPSGAECCLALADRISGSESAFVELMNKKAARLGMDDTHFKDSTGLHDPDHYSTAKDMAILLKYAIQNKTFREIIESTKRSTGVTNVHPDGITFYSTMFKNLPDPVVTGGKILGGKTGYTSDAGLCLASFAEIEGREYILVTAGAPGDTGEPLHVRDAVTIYDRLGEAVMESQ